MFLRVILETELKHEEVESIVGDDFGSYYYWTCDICHLVIGVRSCDGSHKCSDGQVVVGINCTTAVMKQQRQWTDGNEALANNRSKHNVKRGCNAKMRWWGPVE